MEKVYYISTIKKNLYCGEYGEYMSYDFRGTDCYICDIIADIADSETAIYTYDIRRFICDNVDLVNDYIAEFGWPGDLDKAGQGAQFEYIERDLYDNLADNLMLCGLDIWSKDWKHPGYDQDVIPRDLYNALEDLIDNGVDRMSEISELVERYANCTGEFEHCTDGTDEPAA